MAEISTDNGVLVAVDGSPESNAALRWAANEAALYRKPLTLVHVVAPVLVTYPIGPVQANVTEWQEQTAKEILDQARQTAEAALDGKAIEIRTEISYAPIVPSLVEASKHASLVVVGSRGMGRVGRALLGSVSSGLLHHARCPVAVVHDDHTPVRPDAPVLLGIDGSPASEAATAVAFREASFRGVGLVALHAWSDVSLFGVRGVDWAELEEEAKEVLSERLAGWQERYPDVEIQRKVVCDQPARHLIEDSVDAQLVVVGSHGRGGFTGMLMGSVSTAVAQSAKAPVIVVRGR